MVPGPSTSRYSRHDMPISYSLVPLTDAQRQIRLFDLNPGFADDPLTGTLRVVDLATAPEYEALSYAWGATSTRQSLALHVAGQRLELHITDNLCHALARLRNPMKALTIWIDAICIDQASPVEKSVQVSLMHAIYSRSKCTFFWLGEIDEPRDSSLSENELKVNMINRLVSNKSIKQWHERAWVLQEFLFSRMHVLCFGARKSPINGELWAVAEGSIRTMRGRSRCAVTEASTRFWTFIITTIERRSRDKRSLLEISCETASMQATDPRDKIFSLVGILGDTSSAAVVPDYSLAVEEVYSRATYNSIEHEGMYALLAVHYSDPRHTRTASLPSWSIDFNHLRVLTGTGLSDALAWSHKMPHRFMPAGLRPFDFSSVKASDDFQSLSIVGFRLNHISLIRIGTTADERLDLEFALTGLNSTLSLNLEIDADKLQLLAWQECSGWHYPDRFICSVFNTWERGVSAAAAGGNVELPLTRRPGIYVPSAVNTGSEGTLQQLGSFREYLNERDAFFFLASGHMGLALDGVRVGDILVLVQECLLPLVLRARGEDWMFQGFAWVHALDIVAFFDQDVEAETFTIY